MATKKTTKRPITVTTADVTRLGIVDIGNLVRNGTLPAHIAFGIVDERIQRRIKEKRNLIPAVVKFRNELGAKIGQKEIPVPVYPTKTVLEKDPAALAKQIVAAGISPSALVTEITKLSA